VTHAPELLRAAALESMSEVGAAPVAEPAAAGVGEGTGDRPPQEGESLPEPQPKTEAPSSSTKGDPAGFLMGPSGLYRRIDGDWVWLSQPFEVLAIARDAAASNWSKVVRFRHLDGASHEVTLSWVSLHGEPGAAVGALAEHGMSIKCTAPARRAFIEYLGSVEVAARATLVPHTGWVETRSGRAFVLPDEVIGALNSHAKLVLAIGAVRRGFIAGAIDVVLHALDDARHWALEVGNPWAVELGDMASELDPALRIFREVEGRFDALFPEEEEDMEQDPPKPDGADSDLAARLERVGADLHAVMSRFGLRLLVVEDRLGLPMTAIERALVQQEWKRRQAARDADARRTQAFHEAEIEAARVGHQGPLEEFTWRLHAGEFDPPGEKRRDP
jgi:hypothetical protein